MKREPDHKTPQELLEFLQSSIKELATYIAWPSNRYPDRFPEGFAEKVTDILDTAEFDLQELRQEIVERELNEDESDEEDDDAVDELSSDLTA